MKKFNQYLPTILILLLFFAGYVGYNRFVANQAANRTMFMRTRDEIKEGREIYLNEIKGLKTAIQSQDSLIRKYEKDLQWIKGQNEVLNSKYDRLPPVYLPEL